MSVPGRSRLAIVALAAALGACSSGGKGGGGAGWTSTYLFFGEQTPRTGIVAVDPVTLATVAVEPSGVTTIAGPILLWGGTWNPSTALVEDYHVQACFYLKSDPATGENRLYAVDGAVGSSLVPRRLSTFTLPLGRVCAAAEFPDHASPGASAFVIMTAAPDATCATTTVLTQVRLSATPGSAPVTYAGGSASIVTYVPSAAGGIQAWLMKRKGVDGVWVEPGDWATPSPTPLTTTAGPVVSVASVPGKVWITVGGSLQVYSAGAAALADPGNVAAPYPWNAISSSDGQHLYFVAQDTAGAVIQRVRLDGTAPVEQLHPLGAESARALVVSEDRVAYSNAAGEWKAFPKAGGSAVTILSAPGMGRATPYAAGSSFYFVDANALTTCASVDPSGVVSIHAKPGSVTRFARSTASSGRWGTWPVGRVLLIETEQAHGTTTLRAYDGATAAPLGTVDFPPEYSSTVSGQYPTASQFGSGGSERTMITGTLQDGTRDLFALDLAHPGPVRKVTSRPGAYVSCSTGGVAASAPALGLVLALRLLRRRRRPGA